MTSSEKRKLTTSSTFSSIASYGLADDAEKAVVEAERISGNYNIQDFVTLNVFTIVRGTILTNAILWKETAMMAAIYWLVFTPLYIARWDNFSTFVGKEASIRAFIAMFSTLIGLLLSFYTALNLGRWWNMRLQVDIIQGATKKLAMMLSQISPNQDMLRAVNRYGRASLYLIFEASQHEEGTPAPGAKCFEKGLLTDEEVKKLEAMIPHMPFLKAETLWVWLANVVTRMHDQGLTKGPPHYCQLMAAVEEGRSGVEHIQAYLETPIPSGYVHLLCLMVKLHNFILTVLMALASVMLAGGTGGFQAIGVFRTAFRAFFMPFLYNAILILNAEVTDPFGGDPGDFEWVNYDANIAMSGAAFAEAALPENLPEWVAKEDFSKAGHLFDSK
jgi:hypothetical protein